MNNLTNTSDSIPDEIPQWYVLRFLYRDQPRVRARFAQDNIRTFTPSKTVVVTQQGRKIRMQVPIIWDLLFAHSTRTVLDPYVRSCDNLQYKYKTGGKYCDR